MSLATSFDTQRVRVLTAAALVAAAAGLSVATIVDAQTQPAPTSRPGAPMQGGPGMHGGPEGMRGMHMMREIGRLKTSLALNGNQSALWDKAAAQMQPPANMREEMRARHDRMAASLDDPNFDPRKLAAEMDRTQNERRARMTTIRDAWFAVYDSLNPVQRGQVREFLRERMAHRHGMHGMHGGGMHGGMRGGMDGGMHRDGDHGGMPPQPPAPPAR